MSRKEKKLKILWIASWFPTSHSPFNGDFIERMGKAVAPFCDIYLLHVGEGPVEKISVSIQKDVFERVIVIVPSSSKRNYLLRFFWLWKGFRLGLIIGKDRYKDFSMLHLQVIYPLGLFCIMSKFLRTIPWVITEHWMGYTEELKKNLSFFQKATAWICTKRAKVVLPVSSSLLNGMVSCGFKNSYIIIPNVVDLDLFSPSPSPNKKHSINHFEFLVVSSLIDEIKNISRIIRAFKNISLVHSNSILKIVGEGQDKEKLKSLVFSLGIEDRVIFVGAVSHKSVAKIMQDSEALVVFSVVETFSCVMAEALSIGLPIITSNCGGITSHVLPNEGIIVDSNDETGLENAMKRMIFEYETFQPGVRRKIAYSFDSNLIGKRLFDLYQKYSSSDS